MTGRKTVVSFPVRTDAENSSTEKPGSTGTPFPVMGGGVSNLPIRLLPLLLGPGAFSVRLQETEAARRVIPPSSHARLRLRIPGRGTGGQSATSGSKLRAPLGVPGPLPSTRASLSLSGAGPVSVKPEPLDAPAIGHASHEITPPATPLRPFYAGPTHPGPSSPAQPVRCVGQRPLDCWSRLRVGLDR